MLLQLTCNKMLIWYKSNINNPTKDTLVINADAALFNLILCSKAIAEYPNTKIVIINSDISLNVVCKADIEKSIV